MAYKVFTNCVEFVGTACKPFVGTKEYISTGAVEIDHIIESDIELVDYKGKPSRANLEVSTGDILFAKMQGTKKTLLIDEELSGNVYSTGFCAVRAKKGVITEKCLYHLLTSRAFLDQKDKNCSGATQKSITNAGLSKIIINIPDYNEQDAIASQFDAISKVIKQREHELQVLDNLIKARFVEMFGDMVSNPKNWQMVELGTLTEVGSSKRVFEKEYAPEGIPFYRTKEIVELSKGNQISTELFITRKKFDEIKRQYGAPKAGDLLISAVGTIGVIWIVDGKNEFYFKDGNLIRVDGSDRFNSIYMKTVLENLISEYKKQMSSGTAYAALTITGLTKMRVCDAPIALQEEFAYFVAQVNKSKLAVQKALDKSQLLFDSLMQKYFG